MNILSAQPQTFITFDSDNVFQLQIVHLQASLFNIYKCNVTHIIDSYHTFGISNFILNCIRM